MDVAFFVSGSEEGKLVAQVGLLLAIDCER